MLLFIFIALLKIYMFLKNSFKHILIKWIIAAENFYSLFVSRGFISIFPVKKKHENLLVFTNWKSSDILSIDFQHQTFQADSRTRIFVVSATVTVVVAAFFHTEHSNRRELSLNTLDQFTLHLKSVKRNDLKCILFVRFLSLSRYCSWLGLFHCTNNLM